MFFRKYWIPLSVFVVALVGLGLYLLSIQPPPEPIKIYTAVEPLEKPTEEPTAEAPVVEHPKQAGHTHADGTWHAGTLTTDVVAAATQTPETPVAADKVPVSPNGFGPYPENPPQWHKWGPIPWEGISKDPRQELMTRVQVKLLNQGIPVVGAVMDNGLVYPTISGVAYVEWEWSVFPPRRYISSYLTAPETGDRLDAIEERLGRPLTARDVPSDIELRPYDTAGIDPYTFLDLSQKEKTR